MMCIYKITDLTNGKIYVGQTVNFKRRLKEYRSAAKSISKRSQKYLICEVINKKGIENFEFSVIEEIHDESKLDKREIFWINKLNSRDPDIGYNSKVGGRGGKLNQVSKDKMSESSKKFRHTEAEKERRSKSIYVYDTRDGSVDTYKSMKAYANILGIDRSIVARGVNHGIIIHGTYAFRTDDDERSRIYHKLKELKSVPGFSRKDTFDKYKAAYKAVNDYVEKCRD